MNWFTSAICIVFCSPLATAWSVLSTTFQALHLGSNRCKDLPLVENGQAIALVNQLYFTAWSLQCDRYFRLEGPSLVTCTVSTGWSTFGKCVRRIECGQVPRVPNGFLSFVGYFRNPNDPVRKVVCNHGYSLVGKDIIECRESGTWSEPGKCVSVNNCAKFDLQVDNGYAHLIESDPHFAKISCCGGYRLSGRQWASCDYNTGWQWKWMGKCIASLF